MRPIWGVLLVPLLVSPARADTPAEALGEAFRNAATATHQRSDLTTEVDGATSRQVVTRVRPDRTHLVTAPANGPAQEVILIGRTLYTRQNQAWSESPAPAPPGPPLDPTAGLKAIFSQLTERPRQTLGGRPHRVFAGEASWQAGRNLNRGTVEILVDAGRRQPTRLSFTGRCGGRACRFTQTMDFSTSLTVTVPAVVRADAVQLYATTSSDTLAWRQHQNAMSGGGPLGGATTFRKDFATRYQTVIAGVGEAVFYGMTPNGDLFWQRHLGVRDGSDRWLGPIKVGIGWNSFDRIVGGENGVIYGRLADGRLRWHRHLGYLNGDVSWASAQIVGTGWNGFTDIFAGSAGTLYGIRPDGDLIWHRHLGHETGAVTWVEPSRKVGKGWQGIRAFPAGQGVIYGIRPDGELSWFRHHGYLTGEDRSAASVRVDRGWGNFTHVLAVRVDE
jgi:hypothetical protein